MRANNDQDKICTIKEAIFSPDIKEDDKLRNTT